jgi:hypothetical protein
MLMCSVLVLLGQKWVALVRISEIIALSFAIVAGLAIIVIWSSRKTILYFRYTVRHQFSGI